MTLFAIIFAVIILSMFWGGFISMLLYTLKLKGRTLSGPTKNPVSEENLKNG